jgi:2-polyprenyl-3-methyl-5-hydroxy-6-metoxy-1,4-benzoquinol methylase
MTEAGDHVSPQWRAFRQSVDLGEYEERFSHAQAHGEADLIEALARDVDPARSVLDAGCGTGRVAAELHRRGLDVVGADLDDDMLAFARAKAPDVVWANVDLATMQLDRHFGIVAMPGNVMLFCRDADRPAVVRSCVNHLEPGGLLIAGFSCGRSLSVSAYDAVCSRCDLTLVERWATWERTPFQGGDYAVSVHRTL